MATFTDLCNDVYELTKRPDLVAETKMAVRAATLKAHQSDYYSKDLTETGIEWGSPAYYQSLEYRTVFPRWRSLKFLRKYDSSSSDGAGKFFQVLTPDEVLDSYGVQKTDICYLAGAMLEIKSSTQDAHMLIGYYQQPDVVEATYNSWIALDHPFAIVYDAAATIFKTIGFDEQNSLYRNMVAEQLALLRLSNIQAEGY